MSGLTNNDLAFELMLEAMDEQYALNDQARCLWVVDENISSSAVVRVTPHANLQAITNRSDTAQALEQHGFTVCLSDFDFTAYQAHSFDHIFYRVSKEKAVVNHIVNQAAIYLKTEGSLHLSGFKNEGAKTYIEKAAKYLGGIEKKKLGGKTSMIANIICSDIDESKRLDDRDYTHFQTVAINDNTDVASKPGVFGWNKVDRGSAFLIEHLPAVLEDIKGDINKVADLGCGYGYLTVMANQLLKADFFAVDNNVGAVACCQENFKLHGIKGEVSLDSCGLNVQPGFDLVLCNPPFHQGFDVEGGLTDSFVQSASRLLNKGAYAFFVVNAFIPIERKTRGLFESAVVIANNKSFKLLLLKR